MIGGASRTGRHRVPPIMALRADCVVAQGALVGEDPLDVYRLFAVKCSEYPFIPASI